MQTSLFPNVLNVKSTSVSSLVGEISVSYKIKVKQSQLLKVTTSKDAYNILRRHFDKNTIGLVEQFKVLYLNKSNKVVGIYHHSSGSIAATVVDIKIILAVGLKACSSACVISHNHPSGNLTPSQSDLNLTNKLKAAAKLHEIEVMDHLILTDESYYSFADNGMM